MKIWTPVKATGPVLDGVYASGLVFFVFPKPKKSMKLILMKSSSRMRKQRDYSYALIS